MTTKWVLIDQTNSAKTGDGSSLDAATLIRIASACDGQLNNEFAEAYGGSYQVRAGSSPTDIAPGEQVYAFVPTLADAPGASAYHDTNGQGVPVAFCAVTTCGSLLGPTGISVDASHELMEAAADPSCNLMADNLQGMLVAYEVCDPVEVQTYASHVDSGVQVSNFVLPSWFDPKAPAPYDFMSMARIPGAVAPPKPLVLAPGNGGNYVITETSQENEQDTFGIKGVRRKARTDTASRFMRRLLARQTSRKGGMRLAGTEKRPVTIPMPPPVMRKSGEKITPRGQPVESAIPRRSIPVSVQRQEALQHGTQKAEGPNIVPRELNEAGKIAAERATRRLTGRVEVRKERSRVPAQVDQTKAVLAGRKQIREGSDK